MNKKPTRKALLARLREFANDDDCRCTERDHAEADRLLVAYIDDPEIAEAFQAFNKWYA